MRMRTVTVDVDVYLDDMIEEYSDEELIYEMEARGYRVFEEIVFEEIRGIEEFDKEDWETILNLIDQQLSPSNWALTRLRDKIMLLRFGK